MERTVGLKQSFQGNQSDLFAFQPKSDYHVAKYMQDWKQEFFGNGMASFGWTGPTVQRGPLTEVDHFDWKIST